MFKAWKKPLFKSKTKTEDSRAQASEGNGFHNETNSASKVSHNLPAVSLVFESTSTSDTPPGRPHSSSAGPTNSQVAKNEEGIKKLEETVDKSDLEHEDLNRRAEHANQEQEASVKQASTSHIHRLPHDILVIIFILHVRCNQQSPWVLMQINRAWRASAFTTRAIFAGIEIIPKWPNVNLPRRREGREICIYYSQLRQAINRAEAAPLDLKFDCEAPTRYFHRWNDEVSEEWDKMLTYFLQIASRITLESLTIVGRKYRPPFFTNFSPSHLRVLRLIDTDEDVLRHWAETAKKLRVLELGTSVLPYANRRQTWWKNLEQLAFTNTTSPNTTEEYHLIRNIIGWATSLRALEFNRCDFGKRDDEVLSLPILDKLCIRERFNFPAIDAPLLKEMVLHKASFLKDMEYPHLTHIQVTGQFAPYGPHMNTFNAPSLHTLIIGNGSGGEHLLKTWPAGFKRGKYLNPKVLHIRNMYIPPSAFASALCIMTELEVLYLEFISISASLINSLAPTKAGTPCPRLQVINVTIGKRWTAVRLDEFLRPVLQLRAEAGLQNPQTNLRISDPEELLDIL